MPTVNPINPGFSIADADHPSMMYDAGTLALTLRDWREQTVRVLFHDVSRFEWSDEPDDHFDGEPYDGMCIIGESGWIPRLASPKCQHHRLNFNACGGRLDVVCESFDVDTHS